MTAFKDYVTSTAFNLTLSHRQLEMIGILHKTDPKHCHVFEAGPHWMRTSHTLRAKGIATKRFFKASDKRVFMYSPEAFDKSHGEHRPGYITLTKDGKALAAFLDSIGMFDNLIIPQTRTAA